LRSGFLTVQCPPLPRIHWYPVLIGGRQLPPGSRFGCSTKPTPFPPRAAGAVRARRRVRVWLHAPKTLAAGDVYFMVSRGPHCPSFSRAVPRSTGGSPGARKAEAGHGVPCPAPKLKTALPSPPSDRSPPGSNLISVSIQQRQSDLPLARPQAPSLSGPTRCRPSTNLHRHSKGNPLPAFRSTNPRAPVPVTKLEDQESPPAPGRLINVGRHGNQPMPNCFKHYKRVSWTKFSEKLPVQSQTGSSLGATGGVVPTRGSLAPGVTELARLAAALGFGDGDPFPTPLSPGFRQRPPPLRGQRPSARFPGPGFASPRSFTPSPAVPHDHQNYAVPGLRTPNVRPALGSPYVASPFAPPLTEGRDPPRASVAPPPSPTASPPENDPRWPGKKLPPVVPRERVFRRPPFEKLSLPPARVSAKGPFKNKKKRPNPGKPA